MPEILFGLEEIVRDEDNILVIMQMGDLKRRPICDEL